MTAFGILIWSLALAGFSVVLHLLSQRLGKALQDNHRILPLFHIGAALLGVGGLVWAFEPVWPLAYRIGALLSLAGSLSSGFAAWKVWSWLPREIRKASKGG